MEFQLAVDYKLFVGGKYGDSNLQHGGNPDNSISKILLESGMIVTKSLSDATHYLSLDVKVDEIAQVDLVKIPKRRRFLIIQEPEVVLPANYASKYLKTFGTVIRVGRNQAKDLYSLYWPQFWPKDQPKTNSKSRADLGAVLIAGNHLSFIAGELYSLRRKCVYKIDNLQVYGRGWNRGLIDKLKVTSINLSELILFRKRVSRKSLSCWFKNYEKNVESPDNKLEILQNFKITLVIENSQEFLSEKLFDAFFAGCIPIYVGPQVSEYSIPNTLVVQCEPNVRSVVKGIRTAEGMDYQRWQRELDLWLNSPETKERWSHETYILKLSKILEELIL